MTAPGSEHEQTLRYFAGDAESGDIDALQRALIADARVADAFAESAWFESLLQTAFAEAPRPVELTATVLERAADPSEAWHSKRPLVGVLGGVLGTFSEGIPLAYAVATVVIALGLLVGSRVSISHRGPTPGDTRQAAASPCDSSEQTVGRVVGLLRCKWADRSSAAPLGSRVTVGRRFALLSGLLEIHYDNGASVILQGPVTYQVDSPGSGYLSVGKLTAQVEKETADVQSSAASASSSNPQSVIPRPSLLSTTHHPQFAIKTPTAVVTDLGTEFGVEVTASGQVSAHVFRGRVELRKNLGGGPAVFLDENESATVAAGGDSSIVRQITADSSRFVRRAEFAEDVEQQRRCSLDRWQAFSRRFRQDPAMVAYYTFESPGADPSVLPNVSAAGSVLDGTIQGAEWTKGRFAGKSALRFHGRGSSDRVALPEQDRFNFSGPFSIAVWYRAESIAYPNQGIVTKGDSSWRVLRGQPYENRNIAFDTTSRGDLEPHVMSATGQTCVADGRWHLAVAVCEPTGDKILKRLYIDGRSNVESQTPGLLNLNACAVWIGNNSELPDREFQGAIDEVAILSRVLTAQEIVQMFKAGGPPPSDEAIGTSAGR